MTYIGANTELYTDPGFRATVRKARAHGLSWRALAKELRETHDYDGTGYALRDAFADGRLNDRVPIFPLPKLTGWLRLHGSFIITSDWHVPSHSERFAEKMFRIAKRFRVKNHLIAGDLVNLEALSPFLGHDRKDSLALEAQAASDIVRRLLAQFKSVYWLVGNHEARFLKLLAYEPELSGLAAMLLKSIDTKRLVCSTYSYANINDEWRVTHPKSYSRLGGNVPALLTAKYEESVIGAHGHHVGLRFGMNKKHVAVDIGGMFDVEKIRYVMYEDSTHPMWNNAFGMILRNGKGPGTFYLFTDNEKLTDWRFWLGRR